MYMYMFKHFSHLQVHTYDTTKMQEIYADWDCCVCKFNFKYFHDSQDDKTILISKNLLFNVFNESMIIIISKDKTTATLHTHTYAKKTNKHIC